MNIVDKVLCGVFTSYKEYIEFRQLRDCLSTMDASLSSKVYLSRLDLDDEEELDEMVLHQLAVSVLKGWMSREYGLWVLGWLEARRAFIRKQQKESIVNEVKK